MNTVFKFKGKSYDASRLNYDELLIFKQQIEQDRSKIKDSIQSVFRIKHKANLGIDHVWLREADATLERYKDYLAMLVVEIRLRKKDRVKDRPFALYFVDAAREFLPTDQFDFLMGKAKQLQESTLAEMSQRV